MSQPNASAQSDFPPLCEDRWARLHRLTGGRPRALWRHLPVPSPFPAPYGDVWRAARALALAAAPHLAEEDRLGVLWHQGRPHVRLKPDASAHARLALQTTIAGSLRRFERLRAPIQPSMLYVHRVRPTISPGHGDLPHLDVSVHLLDHSSRMIFRLWDNGTLRHTAWGSP
jgi:hypothetical protein